MPTLVEADLTFSVELDGRIMHGTLRGSGSTLVLELDDPSLLGGSGTPLARAVADELARREIRLTVRAGRELVTLGEPSTAWWQRRATSSRHISVASLPAAVQLAKLRIRGRDEAPLVPPPTPLPLAPTFLRRRHRTSTTHDPHRGGYPRLVLAASPGGPASEERRVIFPLGATTLIGNADDCAIRLPGLEARHAEIAHTRDDEFVLTPLALHDTTRINGVPVIRGLLRTGTRIELGGWVLTFQREEYADHGRPYGGRIGGELGHQKPQPTRDQLRPPGD